MENEEHIPHAAEEEIGDEDVAGVQVGNAVLGAGNGNRNLGLKDLRATESFYETILGKKGKCDLLSKHRGEVLAKWKSVNDEESTKKKLQRHTKRELCQFATLFGGNISVSSKKDVLVDTLYDLLLQRASEPSLLEPTEDEIVDAATTICRFKTSHLTSDQLVAMEIINWNTLYAEVASLLTIHEDQINDDIKDLIRGAWEAMRLNSLARLDNDEDDEDDEGAEDDDDEEENAQENDDDDEEDAQENDEEEEDAQENDEEENAQENDEEENAQENDDAQNADDWEPHEPEEQDAAEAAQQIVGFDDNDEVDGQAEELEDLNDAPQPSPSDSNN